MAMTRGHGRQVLNALLREQFVTNVIEVVQRMGAGLLDPHGNGFGTTHDAIGSLWLPG
jgi:hypothetical protein